MAAYSGSNAIWAERCRLQIGIGAEEPPNAVVTTFNVFRVVFQVVGHFTNAGASTNDTRLLSAGLWSIWPPRVDSIDWPSDRLAFDDKALSDLAASING